MTVESHDSELSRHRCQPQPQLQLLPVTAAQSESGSGVEEDFVFAILADFQAADSIEVYDGRAVDAAEDGFIQFLLKFRHAAPQQMGFCAYVQARVIVGGLDPSNL